MSISTSRSGAAGHALSGSQKHPQDVALPARPQASSAVNCNGLSPFVAQFVQYFHRLVEIYHFSISQHGSLRQTIGEGRGAQCAHGTGDGRRDRGRCRRANGVIRPLKPFTWISIASNSISLCCVHTFRVPHPRRPKPMVCIASALCIGSQPRVTSALSPAPETNTSPSDDVIACSDGCERVCRRRRAAKGGEGRRRRTPGRQTTGLEGQKQRADKGRVKGDDGSVAERRRRRAARYTPGRRTNGVAADGLSR